MHGLLSSQRLFGVNQVYERSHRIYFSLHTLVDLSIILLPFIPLMRNRARYRQSICVLCLASAILMTKLFSSSTATLAIPKASNFSFPLSLWFSASPWMSLPGPRSLDLILFSFFTFIQIVLLYAEDIYNL